MMSQIDSWHWKISTGRHFQNGHHNTAQIQHCPISTLFHMWVDYDVLNWFLTSKNFYQSPFSKWPPQYLTNSTLSDFSDISHVGRLWCPEMIPDIENFLPVALFIKGHHNTAQIQHCPISTTFHMLVDYDVPKWFLTSKNFYRSPFSIWPPQYRTNSTLFDFNVLNWFPTLINFYWSPFSKWPPQYRKNSTLFDFKGSF
jgi:hypothetical protein